MTEDRYYQPQNAKDALRYIEVYLINTPKHP